MNALASVAHAVAVGAAAIAAVALAVSVGFLVVAHAFRVRYDGGAPGLWRAALCEFPAFLVVMAWGLLGRRRLSPDDVDPNAEVVVVLVHGAMADGTCMHGWRRALSDLGVPILQPDHGFLIDRLDRHAARMQCFLQRVRARAPRARLVLVGHSMGGVVLRRTLADDDDLRAATAAVVTVASPHLGTAAVRHLRAIPTLAQLGPGHPTLARLPPLHSLVHDTVVVGSAVDAVVYPPSTSLVPARTTVSLSDVGHAALLCRADAVARIAALIRACVSRARAEVGGDVDGTGATC